ncbi:MAG: CCA tRNA nucleotidyltransferase [Cyanobacteria bacterium HKST-UBA03]|nr:CCA tRNA nucleotidyltransferase [Cyanobacteria bacterium HKST-UBA03]
MVHDDTPMSSVSSLTDDEAVPVDHDRVTDPDPQTTATTAPPEDLLPLPDVDPLSISIDEAFRRLTPVHMAGRSPWSVMVDKMPYLVSPDAMDHMRQMHLGHLPVEVIALPQFLYDQLPAMAHSEQDVSNHLTEHFSNFFVAAIYELFSIFQTQQRPAYIIGGLIRDMFIEQTRKLEIHDADVSVEGEGLEAAQWVVARSKNFELVEAYPQFGTAKLRYKGKLDFDFASTRRECYEGCGQLPTILEKGVPLKHDIVRRDFTVNALALSVMTPGLIVDYLGGLRDVQAKQLRVLRSWSFFEDPSRIMRALKYAIRLGFDWSPETRALIERALAALPLVSHDWRGGGERIRDELKACLLLPPSPEKAQWLKTAFDMGFVRLLDSTLSVTLDFPLPLPLVNERVAYIQQYLNDALGYPIEAEASWQAALWQCQLNLLLLGIPPAQRNGVVARLILNRQEIDALEASDMLLGENTICTLNPDMEAARLHEVFSALPVGAVLTGLVLSPNVSTNLAGYVRYLKELADVKLEVTGEDIIKLGVAPGERIGSLLKALHVEKLNGNVSNRSDEMAWLKAQLPSS